MQRTVWPAWHRRHRASVRTYEKLYLWDFPNLSGKPEIKPEEIDDFSILCRKIPKPGGYAVILAEFFQIEIWITTVNRAGHIFLLCAPAFPYDFDTVPKRHIFRFLNIIAQYAVHTRTSGSHPQQFQTHFHSKFADLHCPFSGFDAEISSVSLPTKILTRRDSQQPMQRTEKCIHLISCVVNHFTSLEGSVLDPSAGTMPAGMVALGSNRSCTCIVKSDTWIEIGSE